MPVPTRVVRRAVVVPFLLVAGLVGTGLAPAGAAPTPAPSVAVAPAAAQAPAAVSAAKVAKRKKAKITRAVASRVGRNQATQIYLRERPAVPKRIVRVIARQSGGAWRTLGEVRERKRGKAYALVSFPSSGSWEVQVHLLKRKKHAKKTGRSFPVRVTADFQPQVVAHRGGAGEAPENTLTAYRRAIALGYTAIETDVQETFDDSAHGDPSQLVLMHDATYTRTTNAENVAGVGTLKVNDVPWAKVKGDATTPGVIGNDGQPVPTFAQLLQLVKDNPGVTLHAEAKRPGMAAGIEAKMIQAIATARLTDAWHAGRIIISSFDLPTLEEFKRIDPQGRLSLITSRYADLNAAVGTVNSITLEQPAATSAVINDAHARGFQIYVWTVDDPAFFYRFADARADAIITDIPGSARSALAG